MELCHFKIEDRHMSIQRLANGAQRDIWRRKPILKVALRTESMESHHDKDREVDNPKDSA